MKFHLGEASCPTRAAPSRHTQRPQQNSAPAGQWTSSHHDSEPPPTNEPRAERHNPQTTQHGGRTASPAQPEDKGSSTAWRPKHPLPWHPPSTPAVPWEAAAGTSRYRKSLCHRAWRLPSSREVVQLAGGHGGRTQSEYSESLYPASGLARQCTPPRGPGHR